MKEYFEPTWVNFSNWMLILTFTFGPFVSFWLVGKMESELMALAAVSLGWAGFFVALNLAAWNEEFWHERRCRKSQVVALKAMTETARSELMKIIEDYEAEGYRVEVKEVGELSREELEELESLGEVVRLGEEEDDSDDS